MKKTPEASSSEDQDEIISGYVDQLAYFPGHLLFAGWSSYTSSVENLAFHIDGNPLSHTAVDVVRVHRADLPEKVCGLSEATIKTSRLGFVGIAKLPGIGNDGSAVGKDCTCVIEFADGHQFEQTTEIGAVGSFDDSMSVIIARETDHMPKAEKDDFQGLFLDRWINGPAARSTEVFVDKVIAFFRGWDLRAWLGA